MTIDRRTFLKQVGVGAAGVGLVCALPRCQAAPFLSRHGLPRSTPETQGVSSAKILAFLEAVSASRHEFHSFMMLRHGHVIAEGWWNPYRAALPHALYSLSKSFTSTAVGFAVVEGKLKVDDRVTSFFPNDLPAAVSENLAALRVKDLLTMSVGHAKDSTWTIIKTDNWVKNFLALPIANRPGSAFLYNSGATYMLSAVVQKVTGQRVFDYLKPRIFEPLAIQDMTWETCPRGINTGGWGLSVPTEALAKFGQLHLQKGLWHDRQILPAAWIEEATTFKIQQPGENLERLRQTSDWHQGYCYQFWRCRHQGFRGDGAFGQYLIVLPEQDAVIAITSETTNMQGELDLVWEHLLPAMTDQPLPCDENSQARLKQQLSALALPPPQTEAVPPMAARISGRTFHVQTNSAGLRSVSFKFGSHACVFTLKSDEGEYSIACGLGKWIEGETNMPGTPPRLIPGGSRVPKSKIAAAAAWKDYHTLEMLWRYRESPHHDTVTCRFENDTVKIEFLSSISEMPPRTKDKRPALLGRL